MICAVASLLAALSAPLPPASGAADAGVSVAMDPIVRISTNDLAGVAEDAAVADPLASGGIDAAVEAAIRAAASNAVEKARLEAAARGSEAARLDAEARANERAEAALDQRRISTRVFRLAHANAEELAEKFNATWSGDFGTSWKVSKMAQSFPEANAVMVTAPRMVLDTCQRIVDEVDVEPRQVYIEARFVELSNNASHKLGIDWQMLDGMRGSIGLDAGYNERKLQGISSYDSSSGDYTVGPIKDANGNYISGLGSKTANLSHFNATLGMSELYVILRALEMNEDARTFSNPKIIVTSGKKAIVDMTTKYPNVTIAAKKTLSSNNQLSTDLDMKMAQIPGEDKFMFAKEAFFSWGISLEVTPRIGTNGLINVQIVPTISDCTDFVTAGTEDGSKSKSSEDANYSAKYPIIHVQRLITEFNMASETTAVIGGLSRTIEQQVDSGIPWLRDLWWIGPRLFGSRTRVKKQTEIIVFVTVGLIDPKHIKKDAGLPKNAVLGRLYTDDVRQEPGDRGIRSSEGMKSLDLRGLEEQYADPQRTNTTSTSSLKLPFLEYPAPRND